MHKVELYVVLKAKPPEREATMCPFAALWRVRGAGAYCDSKLQKHKTQTTGFSCTLGHLDEPPLVKCVCAKLRFGQRPAT